MIEARLEDITTNITDGKHGDCRPDENSGYYFISCKDVHDGIVDYSNARQITREDYIDTHRRTLLEPNDILITNSGTIGRMAFVKDIPETYRTTFQKSVAIIKPDATKVIPSFLYYRLRDCVNVFVNQSNGSAQKNLLLGTMRNFLITFPENKGLQKKLADILKKYDDLIENNQKQIKLLEETAQHLYKEWFVDLRFPGYEDVEVVDGVPEGWFARALGDLCVKSRNTVTPEDIPLGTPYIGLEHIPRHDFCLSEWGDASEISSAKARYKKGDIIFGQIRPYFHKVGFAITDGVASTDSFIMTPQKEVWGLFLSTVFSDTFVNYSYQTCKEGAKMPRADWKQMCQYPILVPNEEIRKKFEKYIANLCERIQSLAFQKRFLLEARDRLLPKLMSGEIGG